MLPSPAPLRSPARSLPSLSRTLGHAPSARPLALIRAPLSSSAPACPHPRARPLVRAPLRPCRLLPRGPRGDGGRGERTRQGAPRVRRLQAPLAGCRGQRRRRRRRRCLDRRRPAAAPGAGARPHPFSYVRARGLGECGERGTGSGNGLGEWAWGAGKSCGIGPEFRAGFGHSCWMDSRACCAAGVGVTAQHTVFFKRRTPRISTCPCPSPPSPRSQQRPSKHPSFFLLHPSVF